MGFKPKSRGKNTISEMGGEKMNRINSRLDNKEEMISELEDIVIEII